MVFTFSDDQPIFRQITVRIANEIVKGSLKEGDQVPSTNEFAKMMQINPATAAKGINLLVEQEILYKKRGIGMFVAEGARKKLLIERKNAFVEAYLEPMLIEAKQIDLSNEEIKQLIDERGNAK
ncbi:transcriptional regulator, GntR family [Bacillus sp. JCM 19046]|uniref:DNA-binding transcriptional regulator YhcF (GntR family) n=1 Tax=Shouchella xiaoxiensis TaxID=766895 RepID=A0ABS2T074_9BACI|nr:GntR family transcriptional regulator [Shouchella xiaoxiensis]MBM7841187.1 DNA-binding transcriptional regulator YhcF (GntR family) [Shouchella xiaoxiensis]GAF19328.1 transcriptional regulator, GntR family [Bacillus sp. JCM 19046]